MKNKKGYIHCYTGTGKGKTTSSLGLALRAAGHKKKVFIIQFMKGNINYGELQGIKMLTPYVEIKQFGRETFVSKDAPDIIDINYAREGLKFARDIILSDKYDIVILDEINVALDFKLVTIEAVIDLIKNKPDRLELIFTGRFAPKEILELSHLVTEMREVKHYYNNGIMGREGIEY